MQCTAGGCADTGAAQRALRRPAPLCSAAPYVPARGLRWQPRQLRQAEACSALRSCVPREAACCAPVSAMALAGEFTPVWGRSAQRARRRAQPCAARQRRQGQALGDWEPEVEYEGARAAPQSEHELPSTSQRGPLEFDAIPASIRRRVEDAVEALAARVTAGDVAARAGIRVSEAETALNALAADTLGTLQVSGQGDVLYVLPGNFRAVLRARSWLRRAEPALAAARSAGAYAVRVSFGTALIASVLLVALSVVALLTAASSNDRDNRRGGGGGYQRGYSGGMGYYRSPFSMWFSPFDLFYYWSPGYPARQRARLDSGEGLNFLEGIFSFVFGDGDPNADYEARRWAMVGQLIQARGGVVAAEELAPYLDVTPEALAASATGGFVDEGYVVPALVRFGGQPEVGPDGELLYRFPSLQRTARAQRSKPPPPEHGAALERTWQFSRAGEGQRAGAALLGGANLAGVAYLGSLLGQPGAAYALARNGLGFMLGLFPALQAYAAAFFAIPGLRWLLNQRRNAQIEARNAARLAALAALRAPDAVLRRKLANAARQAQRVVIADADIVFSSDKELAAQPADTEVADFERRLREREARLHQREAQAPPRRVSLFDMPRQSDLEPRP